MRRRYVLTALGAACLAATGCAATARQAANDSRLGSPPWTAGYNGMLTAGNNGQAGADAANGSKPFRLFGRSNPAPDLAADQTPRTGLFSWIGRRNQPTPGDLASKGENEPKAPAGKREVIPVSDVAAVNPPTGQPAPSGGRIQNPFARLGARMRGEQAEIPAATVVEQPEVATTQAGGPIRGMVARWKERQDRRAAEAAAIASLTGPGRNPRSSTQPFQGGPAVQPGNVPGGVPINQPWGRPMMARNYRDPAPAFRTTGAGTAGEMPPGEKVPTLPVAIEVPAPGTETAPATGSLASTNGSSGSPATRKFDITPTSARSAQAEELRPKRLVREWRPTQPAPANPPRIAAAESAPIDRQAETTAAPAMAQPPLPEPTLPTPGSAPAPPQVKPRAEVAPPPVEPDVPPTPVDVTAETRAPAPAAPPVEVAPSPVAPEVKSPEPAKPEPARPDVAKPAAAEPAKSAPAENKPKVTKPDAPKASAPESPKVEPKAEPKADAPAVKPEATAPAQPSQVPTIDLDQPPLPDLPPMAAPPREVSMGSPVVSPLLTGPRLTDVTGPAAPATPGQPKP